MGIGCQDADWGRPNAILKLPQLHAATTSRGSNVSPQVCRYWAADRYWGLKQLSKTCGTGYCLRINAPCMGLLKTQHHCKMCCTVTVWDADFTDGADRQFRVYWLLCACYDYIHPHFQTSDISASAAVIYTLVFKAAGHRNSSYCQSACLSDKMSVGTLRC